MSGQIAVVGSGTMGSGIAHVAAQAGREVLLLDTTLERSRRGLAKIEASLNRLAEKGKISLDDASAIARRITPSADFSQLAGAGLVIEAVFEDVETKRGVIQAVSAVVDADSVFATNTSSISITQLASFHPHPEKVVGMHFFNPVPLMPLVELIRAEQSSPGTVEMVRATAEAFGKTVVEVADVPGFVANRVLMPMINEAILCLEGGVATADAIDQTLRLGANHPMGPLALADLIGLDVVLNIIEVLHRELGEDKYRPAILLKRMVAAGKLGRKSGEGFYVYKK
jgi:3-hydroxybutyryl-CoA dehydrogenase